jgi:hypothetical protein
MIAFLRRQYILLFVTAPLLLGCGSEPIFIAESVRIRIYFMERMAEIEARLNPNYRASINRQERFDQLAWIQMESNESHRLRIVSHIDPEVLQMKWPFEKMNRLPGGHRFPSPLKKSSINQWRGTNLHFLTGQISPLHLGGIAQSEDFSIMPEGFYAIQEIFAKDQSLRASLAVFGPTPHSPGGIYLMAYLGINPFEREIFDSDGHFLELELKATTGAKIISPGKWASSHWLQTLRPSFISPGYF